MKRPTLVLALLLAACAPTRYPAGPATEAPSIKAFTPPPLPVAPSPWAFAPAPPAPQPAGPVPTEALVMPDGARLPLRHWLPEAPPRAIILAIHGFADHGGNAWLEAAPMLNAGGVGLYAYDQRGFGYGPHRGFWAGMDTLVADARTAARLIAARHPGVPVYLLGESLGGAVVLVAGTQPLPIAGIIASAPAIAGRRELPAIAPIVVDGLAAIAPGLGVSASAGGLSASDNEAALRRFGRDPLTIRNPRMDLVTGVLDAMDAGRAALPECCTVPSLILTGGKDEVVPTRIARSVLRTLPERPDRRILHYPEGWHLLLRDGVRRQVAADILAWIGDHQAPLAAAGAAREWLR
ncbi:alpha/beta fold hydrolase [Rhodovarius crocodyli]|uniref:Alpha/beta fold hydrolase n=1 Tax=Rhodovarius crocodyli TaxID=1979269 RepID=A0A437M3Q4_9PROT|nr:alpha/beta fold hydrolase [Rhodovarius crocodyli]RVT92173.1 alpha/beta fold hydrolase [Rhodovarius crocodyli]